MLPASPASRPVTGAARGAREWLLQIALAAAYFGAAKLGLSMAFVSRQVSPVWPPTGLALALVLLLGVRMWPAVFVGALLANATAGEPLATALGIAAGNTLEALAGRWLVRRAGELRSGLDGLRAALAWVVLGCGVAPMLAASVGVTTLCVGHVQPWMRFATLWRIWWVGDALGALVVGSLLLCWLAPRRERPPTAAGTGELLAVTAGAAALAGIVFLRQPQPFLAAGPTLEYTAFPFLIWAGLRCGPRGVALVSAVVSAVAIGGTLRGGGPFAVAPLADALVLLQTYMAVVAASGLLLAAAIAERDRAERERAAAAETLARTLRESAREQRSRAETLADADRRKDEFLAMLSHELRNPLAAASNAVAVLRHHPPAPAGERMLDVLGRQMKHLTRLVDDLLDVSRITRGTVTLQRAPLDLRALVRDAVEAGRPWLREREQELELVLPGEPLPLDGDAARLEQVITNLLHNANKYTPPRGHVVVALERAGDDAVLRVRDDGVGIAPELLPHVFELFVQADHSLARRQGGLGIGLFLVQRIVALHGGSVAATSDGADRGSEITVRLPLAVAMVSQ